eukprot:928460-Prorocentrum_minimum.AAC.5
MTLSTLLPCPGASGAEFPFQVGSIIHRVRKLDKKTDPDLQNFEKNTIVKARHTVYRPGVIGCRGLPSGEQGAVEDADCVHVHESIPPVHKSTPPVPESTPAAGCEFTPQEYKTRRKEEKKKEGKTGKKKKGKAGGDDDDDDDLNPAPSAASDNYSLPPASGRKSLDEE